MKYTYVVNWHTGNTHKESYDELLSLKWVKPVKDILEVVDFFNRLCTHTGKPQRYYIIT